MPSASPGSPVTAFPVDPVGDLAAAPARPSFHRPRDAGRAAGALGRHAPGEVVLVGGPALRAAPFTATVITVMVAVGMVTGTIWHAVEVNDVSPQAISYGAPQTGDHWWTYVVGDLVLPRPEFYLAIGLLLALGLSWYERRVGSLRAAAVFVGTQLSGTVLTALLLSSLTTADWPWAAHAATLVDLGLSAGAVGVLGAATAIMTPVGARRLRLGHGHVSGRPGAQIGAAVGRRALPRLHRRLVRRTGTRRPTGRARNAADCAGQRPVGVALVIAAVAVADLAESVYPGMGGISVPVNPPTRACINCLWWYWKSSSPWSWPTTDDLGR